MNITTSRIKILSKIPSKYVWTSNGSRKKKLSGSQIHIILKYEPISYIGCHVINQTK